MNNKPPMGRGTALLLKGLFVLIVFSAGLGIGNGTLHVGGFSDLVRRHKPGDVQSVQHDLPNDLDYRSVEDVYDQLRQKYAGQLDLNKLMDGLKTGLVNAAGDPYTEYMNADTAKDFNSQLNGTFSGIGAELTKDAQGNIVVVSPISGYPADKAGIKSKDIIAEVDGNSTTGMSVTDVVSAIHGQAGTAVKLKIVRGQNQVLDLTVTRAEITIPSVESKVEGTIGYLKISRFGDDTAQLATQAANTFKQKNVTGIVLDLRGNPGGTVDAAVDVSSLWLDADQTVFQAKRDSKVIQTYRATGGNILKGIPTVVLIDQGSASASEITAGALRDNGDAKLYGTKSYGKGSMQEVIDLGGGNILKVTIAKWFTPHDVNIDKEGITPDVKVAISDADIKAQRDPQLDAAKQALQ